MNSPAAQHGPDVVFFDFGGVLAEEGFRNGIKALAQNQKLDPEIVFNTAVEAVFNSGYLVGRCSEADYWQRLRDAAGLSGTDALLREELLGRFVLRPRMFACLDRLAQAGRRLAILSDQTGWLDELDRRHGFFQRFERVFNSYHVGLHKRDVACFANALAQMQVAAADALFIDDMLPNVELARTCGLAAIHYQTQDEFDRELAHYCPEIGVH